VSHKKCLTEVTALCHAVNAWQKSLLSVTQ